MEILAYFDILTFHETVLVIFKFIPFVFMYVCMLVFVYVLRSPESVFHVFTIMSLCMYVTEHNSAQTMNDMVNM